MKMVHAIPFTRGKTDDRNDDFIAYFKVFNTCALGVVGDFTSNSPRGINERLLRELDKFLREEAEAGRPSPLTTWRERLIPAANIASVVARFINQWLGERKKTARTTLIVAVVDSRAGELHHISVGDSGLAVISRDGVRFITKGDTSGVRDSTGFLPLDHNNFEVIQTPIQSDDLILAYTDGLWENTTHFLNPNDGRFFTGLFQQDSETYIREKIYNQATRQDDMSLLLFKQTQQMPKAVAGRNVNHDLSALIHQSLKEASQSWKRENRSKRSQP